MGWIDTLTTATLISVTRSKSRRYITNILSGLRKHSEQTFWTKIEEHCNKTQSAAESAASAMDSDTTDSSGNRTNVTASVQRQNEAAAYKVVRTTSYTSAWSAWTDYY